MRIMVSDRPTDPVLALVSDPSKRMFIPVGAAIEVVVVPASVLVVVPGVVTVVVFALVTGAVAVVVSVVVEVPSLSACKTSGLTRAFAAPTCARNQR